MRRADVTVGLRVTVKEREQAYYSGRDGRPEVWLEPGTVGVVGAVMVPYVRHSPGNGDYFVCVDFLDADGNEWRAGVAYHNLKGSTAVRGACESVNWRRDFDRAAEHWHPYPCYHLPGGTLAFQQEICDAYNARHNEQNRKRA